MHEFIQRDALDKSVLNTHIKRCDVAHYRLWARTSTCIYAVCCGFIMSRLGPISICCSVIWPFVVVVVHFCFGLSRLLTFLSCIWKINNKTWAASSDKAFIGGVSDHFIPHWRQCICVCVCDTFYLWNFLLLFYCSHNLSLFPRYTYLKQVDEIKRSISLIKRRRF